MYTLFLLVTLPGLWIVILFVFLAVWKLLELCYKLLGLGKDVTQRELFYMLLTDAAAKVESQAQVNESIQGALQASSSERIGFLVILAVRITTIRKCLWFPDQSSRQWELHQPHVQQISLQNVAVLFLMSGIHTRNSLLSFYTLLITFQMDVAASLRVLEWRCVLFTCRCCGSVTLWSTKPWNSCIQ